MVPALKLSDVFKLLINVKMLTIVSILTFGSMINCMLSLVEQEKSFITLRPDDKNNHNTKAKKNNFYKHTVLSGCSQTMKCTITVQGHLCAIILNLGHHYHLKILLFLALSLAAILFSRAEPF